MSAKNFGPSVSGYLDPTNRNYEQVVFEAGKPVLDAELNLGSDLANPRPTASGWVSQDLTGAAAGQLAAIFTSGSAGSVLALPPMDAQVNGWPLRITYTNMVGTGGNTLTLSAPPIGAGDRRTDLIVLEVWRRLLSASPDVVGKSPLGKIWQHGNVKTDLAGAEALNYADDILDAVLGSESTKRVQIQYRLRVITDVDLFAYPYALNDPSIVANSVPAAPAAPDGIATAWPYVNQIANGDGGLWRAGDGNPANTLGTVDGYMYAIPLLGIFRRNSAAFDKDLNHNGGVASPGPSDRPDDLFCDIVVSDDITDLRSASGRWDYAELLDKNLTYLFDNALRSDWMLTGNGAGVQGHSPLYACEIGLPDSPGADLIGDFDAARRTFSDRVILETITVAVPSPGLGWNQGDVIAVDPTSIAIYPYAATNWAAFNDPQVLWLDITRAEWIGSGAGKKTVEARPYLEGVLHLGESPIAPLSILIGQIGPLGLTDEILYLDILVAYPPGLGLTRTPVSDFGSKTFMVNNPAQLPEFGVTPIKCDPAQLVLDAPSGITYLTNALTAIDSTHREVRLAYFTDTLTFTCEANTEVAPTVLIHLPERALTVLTVTVDAGGSGGPYLAVANPFTLSLDGRTITIDVADIPIPNSEWQITYKAVRPIPQNNVQMTLFFGTRAPQAGRHALIGTSQTLVPRYIPKTLWVLTSGSGSPDEGYPFPQAYVQTGGIFPSTAGTYAGEHELSGRASISISTFDAQTGLLALPTYVSYTPNPDAVTFLRDAGNIDAEDRTFFKSVPAGYSPNAYGQSLSDVTRHKVVLPFLAELAATSALGTAGQLVLVLLTRWAKLDAISGVFFDTDLNVSTTSASIFRLRNTLLNTPE